MNRIISSLLSACFVLVLFSCQKEYSFEDVNELPAAGSLWDSAGVCLPDSVHGTFYGGVMPGADTAYVEIQVNVTQTGAYNIVSDQQDGFYFSDSGFFSNTGINTIRLKPVGVPIIPTTSIFTITFDSSFCSFDVVISDSTGTGLGGGGGDTTEDDLTGNWQFTTADGTFSGSFDTAAIFLDTSIWGSGGQMLEMVGFSSPDTAISLLFYLPTGAIVPGTTYATDSIPPSHASIFAFNHTTGNGDPIYQAIPGGATGSYISFIIDSYDTSTHIVTGKFSGIAEDANGDANVTVTNGSFSVKVDQ